MSEKRFTIHKESNCKEEWYAYPFCIKEDGEVFLETIPLIIAEKVRDKLNEQQATIENYRKSRDKWRTKCHQTEEKLDYWKHKSLELYKLLRKINLSDREWEEFLNIINGKELFDDE